ERNPQGMVPVLRLAELDQALTEQFFADADYYFHGVWSQIGANEQHVLKSLAAWQERNRDSANNVKSLEKYRVGNISNLPEEVWSVAVLNLERRDLLAELDGKISFFSEIMRRWVVRETQREAIQAKS